MNRIFTVVEIARRSLSQTQRLTNPTSFPSLLCYNCLSITSPWKLNQNKDNNINNSNNSNKDNNIEFGDEVITYSESDVIRYALGVGASLPEDIRYLYEGDSNFSSLPSYLTTLGVNIITNNLNKLTCGDFTKILHQEQYLESYKPLPTCATLSVTTQLNDILDKRKFSQLVIENVVHDESGEKLARMQSVMLCVGNGHLGRRGKCDTIEPLVYPPNRSPDMVYEDTTSVNQAALYRQCGDLNPLHIDQQFASEMGFPRPILHGLCCYGYALRHVLKCYGNNDPTLFRSMKVQFSKPVFPGEGLTTSMWLDGSRVIFQVNVTGSEKVVLGGGYVHLDI